MSFSKKVAIGFSTLVTPTLLAVPAVAHSVETTATAVAASRTIVGPTVKTAYGNVRVTLKVSGKKVMGIKTVYPVELPESKTINSSAVPRLEKSALKAQSAKIASVSGATYTSTGFKKSLAGALAKR